MYTFSLFLTDGSDQAAGSEQAGAEISGEGNRATPSQGTAR